jgi:CO/xanthine dehydrogenase Mo-binding subunit
MANAIYNATGVRVRDYPITLDKLIAKNAGRCALVLCWTTR